MLHLARRVAPLVLVAAALVAASCGGGAEAFEVGGDVDQALDATPEPLRVALTVGRSVELSTLGADVTAVEVVEGRLPHGLYVTWRGRLAGRPVQDQDVALRLRLTTADGGSREVAVRLVVRGDAPAILAEHPPVGAVGVAYRADFRTSFPADSAVSWRIVRGALPEGLAIDAATGGIVGTPTAGGVWPFVLAAEAGGGVARRAVAIRIGPAVLGAFAEGFEAQAVADHLPNGLVLSRTPAGACGDYGDAGMWTGTFLAGAAWRYAVERSDAARALLERVLHATTVLREITGVDGCSARGFEHEEWQGVLPAPRIDPATNANAYLATAPGYEGWRWQGDTSRDQVTGLLLGNQVVNALGDEAPAREAARNLVTVTAGIWRHAMSLIDPDGLKTRYGALSARDLEGLPLPNGLNAAMFGGWALAARDAAPDADEDAGPFEAMVGRILAPEAPAADASNPAEYDYVGVIERPFYAYGGYGTQWFNVNLSFDALFGLVTRLPDGVLRDRVVAAWTTQLWQDQGPKVRDRRARSEANPWFTYLYFAATATYDADPAYEALEQLVGFPPPPREAAPISNADRFAHDPDQPASSVAEDGPWANEALPVAERCTGTNFVWQKNPYRLDCGSRVGDRFAGTDFLAPYWLGVFYGYVSPDL